MWGDTNETIPIILHYTILYCIILCYTTDPKTVPPSVAGEAWILAPCSMTSLGGWEPPLKETPPTPEFPISLQ